MRLAISGVLGRSPPLSRWVLCLFLQCQIIAADAVDDVLVGVGEVTVNEEAVSDDDADLDDEDFEFFEFEEEQSLSTEASHYRKLLEKLDQYSHFSYSHQVAYEVEDSDDPIVNRSRLRLQWSQSVGEGLFFRFDGHINYDDVYRRDEFDVVAPYYRHQSGVRELYLQYSVGAISLKLGRQLVIWGKADSGVVTDVFSPRDYTELLFTSIENARIGQSMLVLDVYDRVQDGVDPIQKRFTFIVNPDIKSNRYAVPGHPYAIAFSEADPGDINQPFPASTFLGEGSGTDFSAPEVGARWSYSKTKLDYSVLMADLVDNDFLFGVDGPMFFSSGAPQFTLNSIYKRYQLLGGGVNWSNGAWVFKAEGAFKRGVSFNNAETYKTEEHNRWDFSAGFDYNANGNYSVSMEMSHQYIVAWHSDLLNVKEDLTSLYAIWNKTYLHENLLLQLTGSFQLQSKSAFLRSELEYSFSDYGLVRLQLDRFWVDANEYLMGSLDGRDRIAVKLQFDF